MLYEVITRLEHVREHAPNRGAAGDLVERVLEARVGCVELGDALERPRAERLVPFDQPLSYNFV